ncbi:MAG: hypothetical protein QOD81_2246 [Solirubrobacteraceae bacterium]|jgi:hypothetical protein|nr:hypothetical protein [Solirubrobacteraceae bacterium]
MKHVTRRSPSPAAPRRRRPTRPLDLFATIPDERSSAAMDDAAEAERLIEDLLALVDVGLIAPVRDDDAIRYAIVEPDDLTA